MWMGRRDDTFRSRDLPQQVPAAVSPPDTGGLTTIATPESTLAGASGSAVAGVQAAAESTNVLVDPSLLEIQLNRDQAPPISVSSQPKRLAFYEQARQAMAQLLTAEDELARQGVLVGTEAGSMPVGAWDVERIHHVSTEPAPAGDHLQSIFDTEINPGARPVRLVFNETPTGPRMSRRLLLEQFSEELPKFLKNPTAEPATHYVQGSLRHALGKDDPDEAGYVCLSVKSASGRGVGTPVFVNKNSDAGRQIASTLKWGHTYVLLVEMALEPVQPDKGINQPVIGLRQVLAVE
jgi:hypothetical protein